MQSTKDLIAIDFTSRINKNIFKNSVFSSQVFKALLVDYKKAERAVVKYPTSLGDIVVVGFAQAPTMVMFADEY